MKTELRTLRRVIAELRAEKRGGFRPCYPKLRRTDGAYSWMGCSGTIRITVNIDLPGDPSGYFRIVQKFHDGWRHVLHAEITSWQQPIHLLSTYWLIGNEHTVGYLHGRRIGREEFRRVHR